MKKRIQIECPEDTAVNIYTQSKKHLKDDYGRYFSKEILNMAIDRDFSGTDFRVLLAIIGNLGYENIINISQQELGKQLNISQQNISKSIKKLISKEYLQITDKIGRRNIYKFNPNIVFKSRAENHKELRKNWEEDKYQFKNNKSNNINNNIENKIDKKINQISNKFGIEREKAKDILLLVINEGLNIESTKDINLPY